jgi:DNA repair photolyase
MLRLPLEVKDIFKEWLMTEMPDRAAKVMALVKSVRDGKENDATFGRRMTGTGPYAWTIGRRFQLAAERLGINRNRVTLATELFRRPPQAGEQLTLI